MCLEQLQEAILLFVNIWNVALLSLLNNDLPNKNSFNVAVQLHRGVEQSRQQFESSQEFDLGICL